MKHDPLAVLISDCHFTVPTLELASKAFRMAIDKAADLGVPLVDCGDVTDTKAILRAEVVNRLIELVKYAKSKDVEIFFIVGNHSLMNEKSQEHTLHFLHLMENAYVISASEKVAGLNFIPYQNEPGKFLEQAKSFADGAIVFAHQGTVGGQLGHYVKDSTSFDPKFIQRLRIFLGHYHAGYELYNTVSVGTPYTTSFGEAEDSAKGFMVVYKDGSYDRILTNLRKHKIIKYDLDTDLDLEKKLSEVNKDDILWLKLTGTRKELSKSYYDKQNLLKLVSVEGFKFDKILKDLEVQRSPISKLSAGAQLDHLIGGREEIKTLWRKLLSNEA